MMNEYNILISSVGGQGGITLSRVIASTALSQGLNVRVGETLGMAQRGGAVQSHIRIGEDVHGTLIPFGRVNVLLALEPSEAVRVSRYLGPQTKVILNTKPTYPIPVMLNDVVYPELDDVQGALNKIGVTVYSIDGSRITREAKAPRSLNIVILGAYMALGDPILSIDAVKMSMEESPPKRFLDQNLRVFKLGYEAFTL